MDRLMGAVTQTYRASVDLTVTALQSLAASGTWVSGWVSGIIDNTSQLDLDKAISAKFVPVAATTGEIRVYAIAMMDDTNWPDILSVGTEGTEGAGTFTSAEVRDANATLVWSSATTATSPKTMPMTSLRGVFGGVMPPKVILFVAISGSALSTGNQVTVKGLSESVA